MSDAARVRIKALKRPGVMVLVILGIAIGISVPLTVRWLYLALPRGTFSTLIGVITILAGGTVLFWFRESHRLYYGALELGVALAVAVHGLDQMQTPAESWPAIVAAVYLVVRALDNIWKAVEPDAAQPERPALT